MDLRIIIYTLLSSLLISCDYLDFQGVVDTYIDIDERFEQSIAWNEEYGTPSLSFPNDQYTFHIISDIHIGGTNNLNHFLSEIADSSDGIFLLGDLCSGNSEDYDSLNSILAQSSSNSLYPIVGNHDLYFDGWEHYYKYLGSSTYQLIVSTPIANDLYIFLDTGGGTLGQLQLAWLKTLLEEQREKYRHCTILTHNNILRSRPTISTFPMNEEVKVLLDLFLIHNVNYCIAGHDHKYDAFAFGGTQYVVTDALADYNKDASYLTLSQDKGILSTSRHPLD